jgi:hypothetical protein
MEMIDVDDLPPTFNDDISRFIAHYTIAFVGSAPPGDDPPLLGTGVLVEVEGRHAILTAQHVLPALPRTGRLGVLLGPTNHVETVDTAGLHFLDIAKAKVEADGPDLGAVVMLKGSVAATVGAKKTFFNLTLRREAALQAPRVPEDGVWVANGFLHERTKLLREADGRSVKGFYNFSALGRPEVPFTVGDYDYFDYLVDPACLEGSPARWNGMSGGGLWQVQLKREGGSVVPVNPLLSGILFYQHLTAAGCCGVRTHGRESVYRVAYERLQKL